MKLKQILAYTNDILTEQMLAEMANIPADVSGIGSVYMYASTKDVVNGRHGPRIKISNVPNRFDVNDCFVMLVDKFNPTTKGIVKLSKAAVRDIEDWVRQNFEVLMSYWNKAPYPMKDGTVVGPILTKPELIAALTPLV